MVDMKSSPVALLTAYVAATVLGSEHRLELLKRDLVVSRPLMVEMASGQPSQDFAVLIHNPQRLADPIHLRAPHLHQMSGIRSALILAKENVRRYTGFERKEAVMGQPRKGQEKNRNIRLGVRVTEPMYEALQSRAQQLGCDMSDIVVRLLSEELDVPASETDAEKEARMRKTSRRRAA
jgi:hypothetical protein